MTLKSKSRSKFDSSPSPNMYAVERERQGFPPYLQLRQSLAHRAVVLIIHLHGPPHHLAHLTDPLQLPLHLLKAKPPQLRPDGPGGWRSLSYISPSSFVHVLNTVPLRHVLVLSGLPPSGNQSGILSPHTNINNTFEY